MADLIKIVAYYFPESRENEGKPGKAHATIETAVKQVNRQYARLGIPFEIQLQDLRQYIYSNFDVNELSSQLGQTGDKETLIDKLLAPISFEQCLSQENITSKVVAGEEKWYKDGSELLKIRLEDYGITPDAVNARFRAKNLIKGVGFAEHDIVSQIIDGTKESGNSSEHRVNKIKEYLNLLLIKPGKYDNINTQNGLEKIFDKLLANRFYHASKRTYEIFHETDIGGILNRWRLYCFYVNSIPNIRIRKEEFDNLLTLIENNYRQEGRSHLYRVRPFKGHEEDTKDINRRILSLVKTKQSEGVMVLLYPYHYPDAPMNVDTASLLYVFFRPISGQVNNLWLGDISQVSLKKMKYTLLHEMAHLTTRELVSPEAKGVESLLTGGRIADDEERFDRRDERLMAAPIKFDDIALRKKISDKSVMHAYKPLIESYREYLSKSRIDGK